ncbi:S1C family serine protease [Cupriavidus sp. 2MCAB6]|uniref:S1C family serine protease n=1 Tax=Cupriavidus sp. 2MCAB6 TaxID=3232981 RepID=UPI003F91FCAF
MGIHFKIRKLHWHIALLMGGFLSAASCLAMDAGELYEKRSPSIWLVSVYNAQGQRIKLGSSVVIGQEELVTNCHVLAQGKAISIKHENTLHEARLVHADVERDLCILRAKGLVAPAVKIAPASTLKVGQRVFAIGAPSGMELTLSDGLVAALNRDRDDKLSRIQISAPISGGSSGGGLFDTEGRLLGIPYLTIREAQNLNFAIPAEWIAEVPARAKVALAKFRAESAAPPAPIVAASSPRGTARPAAEPGQRLSGDDLSSHFANLTRIVAISPNGTPLELEFKQNGAFGVTNMQTRGYSDGRWRIMPESNEVCFDMGNPRFIGMQHCYQLVRYGQTYTMRSVSGSYFFTYSMQGS